MDQTNSKNLKKIDSRRKFILKSTAAGALILTLPDWSLAIPTGDSRVKSLMSKIIGIDAHNHIDVPFDKAVFASQQYLLAEEMQKSGFSAICMTFCVDRPELKQEGEAFDRFTTSLDEMDVLLQQNDMSRAVTYADLKAAKKKKQPVVIQSVEGGHFLEGKIERLEIAYDRGLRHLGLLHDAQSAYPLGDIYTNPEKFGGLTEFGKEVVKSCNMQGILVDLTHCSDNAILNAIEISNKPMLVSHTGLNTRLGKNEKFANMMLPRLISESMAKKVADSGGVVGVWTHLADSITDFVQNIRAMVDVIGAEHVCIGTDSKMAVSAGGDPRFGKKTNDYWSDGKQGFLYAVIESMITHGFSDSEITNICGGNYLRVFKQAVG